MSVDVNVPERITDQALDPGHNTEDCESDAAAASHGLFITPTRRGDSFKASIHGHMLELADPTDHRLAPSPAPREWVRRSPVRSRTAWQRGPSPSGSYTSRSKE
jgi:hypothetical protein